MESLRVYCVGYYWEIDRGFLKNNIKLLRGDWTKRDPIIGKWLEEKNIYGVPAYFFLDSNGTLHYLGETISISKIEKHLYP